MYYYTKKQICHNLNFIVCFTIVVFNGCTILTQILYNFVKYIVFQFAITILCPILSKDVYYPHVQYVCNIQTYMLLLQQQSQTICIST